jgi:RHS repeat-associated protein
VLNDNLGRPETITQPNQSKIEYHYDPITLRLDTETVSYDLDHNGSFEFTRLIDRSNDFLGRNTGYSLIKKTGLIVDAAAHYGYDVPSGRLRTVDDDGVSQYIFANNHFTYEYVANSNSNLIDNVIGGRIRVYNTWEDDRDLLKKKKNLAINLFKNYSTFDYTTNPIGQREKVIKTGQDSQSASNTEFERRWGYDSSGQLTQENDKFNDDFDRGFNYDAIGNRTKSIAGSTDVSAAGVVTYTPTALNQYAAITGPALAPITPQYDDDGNTTSSSIRPTGMPGTNLQTAVYHWDGENRLIKITRPDNTLIASYQYDAFGRRISDGRISVYDGWNPIALYASDGSMIENYLWGLDISGSLQGAGGVGGLLAISYSSDPVHYPTYDGNGNVSEYIESYLDPDFFFPWDFVVAHYQYDAFGNVTLSDGWLADHFRFRFSTKQQDNESGLLYYGYRYYDPLTGRWPSRDPIGESGGVSLYGFVGNGGINLIDFLGWNIITVSGGINVNRDLDSHDNNWRNFITAAELRLKELRSSQLASEEIEWLVEWTTLGERLWYDKSRYPFRNFFLDNAAYQQEVANIANKYNAKLRIFTNKKEFAHIINTEPETGKRRRGNTRITDFAFYGHGDPGHLKLNYNKKEFDISSEDIKSGLFLKSSFTKSCKCVSWACRSANTQEDGGPSIKNVWEDYFSINFRSVYGRTEYGPTASGLPPVLGLQNGPGSPPSEWR